MKIRVVMKTPDALDDALDEAVQETLQHDPPEGLSRAEWSATIAERREKAEEKCRKWMRYGECIDVEIDTEADTAVVVRPR